MWTLGKFVILTRNELIETVNDEKALAYRRGLHSKWRAKKKGNETEQLLAAIDPSIVLPPKKAGIDDVTNATWPGTGYSQGSTVDLKAYGDSLPIDNPFAAMAPVGKDSDVEDAA